MLDCTLFLEMTVQFFSIKERKKSVARSFLVNST